jgi:hypothetical protein
LLLMLLVADKQWATTIINNYQLCLCITNALYICLNPCWAGIRLKP